MNDILDEIIEIKNISKKFSKCSFIISLITTGCFIYLFTYIPRNIVVSQAIPTPPVILIYMMYAFCLVGLTMAILSFVKKEPSTWFKWVGGILSILLFLFIGALAIIAKVL